MNELLVVFFVLATIAAAYFWVYPKFAGDNVKLMAWLDIALTAVPVGLSAAFFWQSDQVFRFIFFDTNWFFFTILTMVVLELPMFYFYLKARGLSHKLRELYGFSAKGSKDSGWATASTKSVEKVLNDSKWNGLRTSSAKRFLFWGANISILFGTGFLFAVGDNVWASYSLIHILLIFIFWALLRQSVRLVADAPEEALDEMLLKKRNESYVVAFRWLATLGFTMVTALIVFAILTDAQESSDGFNYQIALTWPQVQAIFWVFAGYSFLLPSLAMTYIDITRSNNRKSSK
ncbi:MAG: hypothetical protein RLZZ41_619 [Actinomycetota bacterium]|jgi:hypothetical protein